MATTADDIAWILEPVLARIVRVPRSSYQAWARDRLVARPESGAYTKLHVVEAMICLAARPHLSLAAARKRLAELRESGELNQVVDFVRDGDIERQVDLVIDVDGGTFSLCYDDEQLARTVRPRTGARAFVVCALGAALADAMTTFDREAVNEAPPSKRRRGRPAKPRRTGDVVPLPRDG